MSEIKINYNEVEQRVSQMRAQIRNELMPKIESGYSDMADKLSQMDGGTNAALIEAAGSHKNKSVMAAQTLDKLLSFMMNSSEQLEQNEQRMAAVFSKG
jgi:hypothetical protein